MLNYLPSTVSIELADGVRDLDPSAHSATNWTHQHYYKRRLRLWTDEWHAEARSDQDEIAGWQADLAEKKQLGAR